MSEGYLPPAEDEIVDASGRPAPQGLFDPAQERDACGVGFIADMKGRKSHKIVEDALQILANLEHRGAVGADPLSGDGAGILIQIPHDFLADECEQARLHAAASPATTPSATCSCRRTSACARTANACGRAASRKKASSCSAGARCRSTTRACRRWCRGVEPVHRQVFIGRPKIIKTRTSSSAASISSARSSRTRSITPTRAATSATTRCACRRARSSTRACSCRIQVKAYYKDLSDPRLDVGAGARAPALLDQHLPVVEARAPLPHGRAQRRNQHAARQRQLDGGASGVRLVAAVRRRHLQALADLLRRPVRHRLLRQRARIPDDGRLLARARRDDADPGSLGRQSDDGCASAAPSTSITPA